MIDLDVLSPEEREALAFAEKLLEAGIPVRRARPDLDPETGEWRPKGGNLGNGYWLPKRWPDSRPSRKNIEEWQPGDALVAIMGYGLDLIDVDPRNGGDASLREMKTEGLIPQEIFAIASTPSGGRHLFVRSTGQRSCDDIRPGIDVKAGDGTGQGGGHGLAWIAPTRRISKTTGYPVEYEWTITKPLELEGVEPWAPLVEELSKRKATKAAGSSEWSAPDGEQHPEYEEEARRYVAKTLSRMRPNISSWNKTLYGVARDLARVAHGRCGIGVEELEELLLDAAGPWDENEVATVEQVWARALTATSEEAWAPPADSGIRLADLNGPTKAVTAATDRMPAHTLSEESMEFIWLRGEIGRPGNPLEDLFRAGDVLTHPVHGTQTENNLHYLVQRRYRVYKMEESDTATKTNGKKEWVEKPAVYPKSVVTHVMGGVTDLPNIRELRGVTPIPFMREDGSLLSTAGYDEATGLWLQEEIEMPEITREQAQKLIMDMLQDFPFTSPNDRSNFIAAMFLPIIRGIAPPPWPMLGIGAHQRGTGKGFLAHILITLFGGSLGALSSNPEEQRKNLASQLAKPAGVTVFDNYRGDLKGQALEALLTSSEFSDRVLGESRTATYPNDRLWVVAGNNIKAGPDMGRRLLMVNLDAGMARPETRTSFHIDPFKPWVVKHRLELLAALLKLAGDWHTAGSPSGVLRTTDDFGHGLAMVEGLVEHAQLSPGGEVSVLGQSTNSDDQNWSALLQAIAERFPNGEAFRTRDLVMLDDIANDRRVPEELLPLNVLDGSVSSRSQRLGKYFANRLGQWVDGRQVVEGTVKDGSRTYRVIGPDTNGPHD